jgi:hypothetical protein
MAVAGLLGEGVFSGRRAGAGESEPPTLHPGNHIGNDLALQHTMHKIRCSTNQPFQTGQQTRGTRTAETE